MASIPHFYSNYSFPYDFSQFPNPLLISQENSIAAAAAAANTIPATATWGAPEDISFPMFLDNAGVDHVLQQEYNTNNLTSSVPSAAFFPAELIGISSDLAGPVAVPVPTALTPDHDNNFAGCCGINGTIQNFGSRYQLQDICEVGEECNGRLVQQDFKPIDPTLGENNWGIQGNGMAPAMDDNNLKVGRYSVEERKDRILRYLKKRNQRNFNKTIKYACRKTLADRRVRVRGRFARNTELCDQDEMVMKKEDDHSSPINDDKLNMYCYSDAIQQMMKHEEDEWLQEAMANLMYLPYIAG